MPLPLCAALAVAGNREHKKRRPDTNKSVAGSITRSKLDSDYRTLYQLRAPQFARWPLFAAGLRSGAYRALARRFAFVFYLKVRSCPYAPPRGMPTVGPAEPARNQRGQYNGRDRLPAKTRR